MPIEIQPSKAARIRLALEKNPELTSSELAELVGADPGYVRAALYRAGKRTKYALGVTKGRRPKPKSSEDAH